jgi:hypothetical protein
VVRLVSGNLVARWRVAQCSAMDWDCPSAARELPGKRRHWSGSIHLPVCIPITELWDGWRLCDRA